MYKDDYAAAGLHMLPFYKLGGEGQKVARTILGNCVALLVASALPTLMGLTGKIYLIAALFLGTSMTAASVLFFMERSRARALQLFLASIFYIPILVAFMVLNTFPSLS